MRLPDPERLVTLDEEPGGLRSLARMVRRNESAAPASVDVGAARVDVASAPIDAAAPADTALPVPVLTTEAPDR